MKKAKGYLEQGVTKALLLLGIADPDIVDETVVYALSGKAQAKSNFKVGKAKVDFVEVF